MGEGPRVSLVGTSGAGKTTIGRSLAARVGVPFLELDSLRHQAGWMTLPDDEFRRRVSAFTETSAWVVDGNYLEPLGGIVQARATTIVWLDLPRWLVMLQVVWRSARRAITRRPMWNGNVERIRDWADPEHPIRWAWSTHAERQARFAAAADDRWVRLRSRHEAARWVAAIAPQASRSKR